MVPALKVALGYGCLFLSSVISFQSSVRENREVSPRSRLLVSARAKEGRAGPRPSSTHTSTSRFAVTAAFHYILN